MMNIEYLNPERMAPAGSELINYIQNNSTPTLDLLVREAIQNSLDAADKEKPFVNVNFNIKMIDPNDISKHFEIIEDNLDDKYGDDFCSILTVKDSNTTGLTGPLKTDGLPISKYGNLCKLVYDINKKQQTEGAGGAWGIGKTIFFRLGIGLVLYYTRIKAASGYEERLVACLIEDESSEAAILPARPNKTNLGIAWWGEKEPGCTKTVPLTDSEKIHEILEDFKVEPYTTFETGTTVIVPYVNMGKLIKELSHEENPLDAPFWCKKNNVSEDNEKNLRTITEYLKIAIRKWYAPRINKAYDGIQLKPYVNGDVLKCDESILLFNIIQKLYNSRPKNEESVNGKKIISKEVCLRERFSQGAVSGWINYIKLTDEDLGCFPPRNQQNPYYYLFNNVDEESPDNPPIIMFTRKQGMIVNYQTKGNWVYNIPSTQKGEYIIGFYIANPNQRLRGSEILLDEYLRKGEKADHMDWSDIKDYGNLNIVDRIQKNSAAVIKKDFTEQPTKTIGIQNVGLGRKLAKLFMPPSNFSTWDKAIGGHSNIGGTGGDGEKPKSPTPTKGIRHKKPVLEVTGNPVFERNQVTLPVRIFFARKNRIILSLLVQSEAGNYTCDKWEKQTRQEFPIEIKDFIITSIKEDKKIIFATTISINSYAIEKFDFNMLISSIGNKAHSIEMCAQKQANYILEGKLIYSLQGVKGIIQLKDMEDEGK